MRSNKRKLESLRPVSIELSPIINAEGSCIIKYGNTHVICTATIESKIPFFLKGKGSGWITAEYSMLPASGIGRITREISANKQNARNVEIQRLISRSLRACIDLKILGERQIIIDCDVINADGGTRCASITGGYIALSIAINSLLRKGIINKNPINRQIAAVSIGIYKGDIMVDLDYIEDSDAEVDGNFIISNNEEIVEIQCSAERKTFTTNQLLEMIRLAHDSCKQLFEIQKQALSMSMVSI